MDKKALLKKMPLVGIWGINHLLICLFHNNQLAEGYLRGKRYARIIKAIYPLYIGKNVIIRNKEAVVFGENVSISDNVYLNGGKYLRIGSDTHVDVFSSIYGLGGVEIGEKCAIAAGVRIYSQTNQYGYEPSLPVVEQPIKYAPVKIGNDVWIGTNAVILPGVTIGDHSVVGAGSVVISDIPPHSVVAGVPARVVKKRILR